MKVCVLTTSYPRYAGDYAGVFVFELVSWLVRGGVTVEVIAPSEAGLPVSELIAGIHVRRFRYMFPSRWQRVAYLGGIPSNLRRYWLAWIQLPFFFLSYFLAAFRAARECDVIHAHWISSGLIASLLSTILSKPVVLTVHGSDVNVLYENRLLGRLRRYLIDRADAVIAVSTPLAERVCSLGIKKEKVNVISNGVDITLFRDVNDGKRCDERLIWVGRMSEEKGLKHLLSAMPRILKEYPHAELYLLGDGPMRQEIEKQIDELGVSGSVRLVGMVPHDQVPSYLSHCDVFVMPSLSEGLPLVLLEAMSAARPVVATAVGGIPDIVITEGSDQNGLLVPPADSEALAVAIISVLGDPDKAGRLGASGRRSVERNYTWNSVARKTIDVYECLCSTRDPG